MKICNRPRSYLTNIPFPQELEYGDHQLRDSLREAIVQMGGAGVGHLRAAGESWEEWEAVGGGEDLEVVGFFFAST